MPKRPTKRQRLAIEAIDFRLEQLGDMLLATNCVLCQAFIRREYCKGCPAKRSKFSCTDFNLAVKEIRISLVIQRSIFSKRLNKLAKEAH